MCHFFRDFGLTLLFLRRGYFSSNRLRKARFLASMKLFDLGENATRSKTEEGKDRRQDVTTALLQKELDCTRIDK